MNYKMLSIIIPTLNEENYLPRFLESIKKQSYRDYEIIVSDGSSTDKTQAIAKKYGCRLVIDKKKGGPSLERNFGAKSAKGNLLLFLDADTILPKGFLSKNVAEFIKRDLGVATCFQAVSSDNLIDRIYFKVSDFFMYLGSFFYPGAYGCCIFTKKEVFDKLGGFDERITLFEDHDYATRASKISKYGVLFKSKITVSARRYEKFGRGRTILKNLIAGIYRGLNGKITDNRFAYHFNYKK
jgi:glycosyltransferase involved in cell wall biosynthesis